MAGGATDPEARKFYGFYGEFNHEIMDLEATNAGDEASKKDIIVVVKPMMIYDESVWWFRTDLMFYHIWGDPLII
jgi:hypothetical protein